VIIIQYAGAATLMKGAHGCSTLKLNWQLPELIAALQQMPALLQKTLKVVPAPLIEGVLTAPPVLEVPNPTVECKCGNCGAVLMRGEEGKAYPLLVHCVSCGSYNSTDV
jgi:hypothetical protein